MTRMLIGLVLLGIISAAWVERVTSMYNDKAFVSAETMKIINETLMVTAEHRDELNRSARIADELAMGVMGLLIGAVIGGCAGRFSDRGKLIKAAVAGAVLGGVTGAMGGYIGHAFQAHVYVTDNSTVNAVLRMIAMFLPFAISMGLAASLSGEVKRDVSDAVVSAILGTLIAATVYGLASDANPLTREQSTDIMPRHLRNKVLFIACLSMFTLLMIAAQMLRKPKTAAAQAAE